MAQHTAQIFGVFPSGENLKNHIDAEINKYPVRKIVKIGIQLKQGHTVILNDQTFEIGPSETLQLDDVEIKSISLFRGSSSNISEKIRIPVMIDLVYDDKV
jgi:hypothetical protein